MITHLKSCCLLLLVVCGPVLGEVSVTLYRSDMQSPMTYQVDPAFPKVRCYGDIMVATHVVILVSSDTAVHWNGALTVENEHRLSGVVQGRDYNPQESDYRGSHLPPAGERAKVYDWLQSGIAGLALEGHSRAVAGDWFIVDYTAISEGLCKVRFYDWYASDPVRWEFQFTHVRTRDFNLDGRVDFADFAFLACAVWAPDEGGPLTEVVDLNGDGAVDSRDMALFCQFWLDSTQ